LASGAHVRLLGRTQRVVHAVAPAAIEGDPVGGIGQQEPRLGTIEQAGHVVGIRAVAAQQALVAEDPELARLRARRAGRGLEGGVEIEALDLLALLAGLERAEQVADLVLAEARQRQIDLGPGLQVGQEPGQEGVIP